MELRNSHSLIKSSRSALIDRLLEGYDNARHGTGVCGHVDPEETFDFCVHWQVLTLKFVFQVFGETEFLDYQRALTELADVYV